MPRLLRFFILLLIGLAVLAWFAARIVTNLATDWFQRDMTYRAQLAVNAARSTLLQHWTDHDEIRRDLENLTIHQRILAAAVYDPAARLLASTSGFTPPPSLPLLLTSGSPPVVSGQVALLQAGPVFMNAVPLLDQSDHLVGYVILVHDTSFVERRATQLNRLILIAFIILTCAASLFSLVAARFLRQGWTTDIRQFIHGGPQKREFQPILRDLRELLTRISREDRADRRAGAWTPARLKSTLSRFLKGEKIIVLANREPYVHNRENDGSVRALHPASGLVTAIEPVMRACGGTWVAHGSGTADRDTADAHGRLRVPPGEESYTLRRIWLTPQQEQGYYYGFANEGLWPLCHLAHARPLFRADDWDHYRTVNQLFADAVCEEARADNPIILVQDYHFALAPRLLRDRLPRATIITFWHIPWPNAEHFGICPWSQDLLEGLLGSSIVGFHTQLHCNNFLECIDRFLEARIDREDFAVIQHQRSTLIRAYPISVEWPNHWLNDVPTALLSRQSVIDEFHLPPNALIGVGVDRLDYTKGLEERLWAVERLLEKHPRFRNRFTFFQLAAPSRTVIPRYRQLDENLQLLAARINHRFGTDSYKPVILLRAHHEPPTVFRFLRAADLCYVSSLHDGMNLVAKEFILARDDEHGVLVLSHFTGASRELSEALIVNPYDLEEASNALAVALTMHPNEQADRMRAMRALVAEFNIFRWAGRMLIDAANLRARDRSRHSLRRLSYAPSQPLAPTT